VEEINGGSESFFSEKTYKAFLEKKNFVRNMRSRSKNKTIFDVVLSEEADFTKHPEGEDIVKVIRSYE